MKQLFQLLSCKTVTASHWGREAARCYWNEVWLLDSKKKKKRHLNCINCVYLKLSLSTNPTPLSHSQPPHVDNILSSFNDLSIVVFVFLKKKKQKTSGLSFFKFNLYFYQSWMVHRQSHSSTQFLTKSSIPCPPTPIFYSPEKTIFKSFLLIYLVCILVFLNSTLWLS